MKFFPISKSLTRPSRPCVGNVYFFIVQMVSKLLYKWDLSVSSELQVSPVSRESSERKIRVENVILGLYKRELAVATEFCVSWHYIQDFSQYWYV